MDYTSGAGYITVGGVRVFQDQNLAAGINGSDVDATWLNGVQASILDAVTAAGLTPTDADNTQLQQAILILTSGRRIASEDLPGYSAGTFTPQAATKLIRIRMLGGGGCGGGGLATSTGQVALGGGGGSGSYFEGFIANPVACPFQVGATGAAGPGAGPAGLASWFGAYTAPGGTPPPLSITCFGGGGGAQGAATTFASPIAIKGAAGGLQPLVGSGVGIVLMTPGAMGGLGLALSATMVVGSDGGAIGFSAGGYSLIGTAAGQPNAGSGPGSSGPGSGGSGAALWQGQATAQGGQAYGGYIIIDDYN
jgi:hypothetical protein